MIFHENFAKNIERKNYHDYNFKKVMFDGSNIQRKGVHMRRSRNDLLRRNLNIISA